MRLFLLLLMKLFFMNGPCIMEKKVYVFLVIRYEVIDLSSIYRCSLFWIFKILTDIYCLFIPERHELNFPNRMLDLCLSLFFFYCIYSFMRDTHREAEIQAEGETGSMRGARRGTPSRASRIRLWAEGGAKPLSNRAAPSLFNSINFCFIFLRCFY